MRESTVGAGVEMGASIVREGREIGSDPALVLSEAGKLSLMVVNHLVLLAHWSRDLYVPAPWLD